MLLDEVTEGGVENLLGLDGIKEEDEDYDDERGSGDEEHK